MSMTLRLDTAGLRSLIEDNPDFKIEIQKAVLNNINQDNLDNAVTARLEALLLNMCSEEGSYYNRKLVAKDPKLVAALTECVKQQASQISEKAIQDIVTSQVTHQMSIVRNELRTTMKEAMLSVMTAEMAKEILIAKLV